MTKKSQTIIPENELLEDVLFLLAEHLLEGSSSLTFAGDLIGRCKEAGSPSDLRAIQALKEALQSHGIPMAAIEISLTGEQS